MWVKLLDVVGIAPEVVVDSSDGVEDGRVIAARRSSRGSSCGLCKRAERELSLG